MRFFFFTDPATTEIYTLSLHDALPICRVVAACGDGGFLMTAHELETAHRLGVNIVAVVFHDNAYGSIKRKQLARFGRTRSEEHTSELQSLTNLVCRLLLEKKNKQTECK